MDPKSLRDFEDCTPGRTHILLSSKNCFSHYHKLTPKICFYNIQVQEIGLMTYNCSCMADDMSKIFEVYWDLAQKGSKIPDPWPDKYKTTINAGQSTGH